MKWCAKCVTPDTRPRVEFDEHGVCNACRWHEQKQRKIDWPMRETILRGICDKFRRKEGFDVIVPCSGGKDGSYVAWKLKHEYDMHPLCITFASQIPTPIGRRNLENFRQSGFDHILITPNSQLYRRYATDWFIKRGMPKQPFVVGIQSALFQEAVMRGINFLMYGEQGEVEYGGNTETRYLQKMTREFLTGIYWEGQDPSREYGWWWKLPDRIDYVYATWWSLYEDWDPQDHARLAKEKCGLEMLVGGSIGTFTNHSQLDDVLQDLHAYLMFVKFGFGRCTSDASIEIRRGRMTREQGVEVVRRLDGQFPVEYLSAYLDYFGMDESEFWAVIESHVNKDILVRTDNAERPWVLRDSVR